MTRLLPLAAIAALVLTVGACAGPSAETSSAGGSAGATARAGTGDAEAGGEKKLPWWRLSQYSRGPAYETPEERDRKRPGLFSGKEGGFVLYREGEAGRSSDPTKPAKVRR